MSSKRFAIIGGFVLVVAVFVVYSGVFWNDFVEFDDNLYVTQNSQTASGLSRSGFYYAWTTIDTGNWIPITWLSFQLDASLYGIRSAGFHATNLILHCANVVLLFTWLIRVTGLSWPSLVAAGLFGLHPLHVESVAWVAERKDVLSTFWMLIALHFYERYASRPSVTRYLLTCAALILGLLAKSMLVTLPLLFLAVDIWPLKRWRHSDGPMSSVYRYPRVRPGLLFLEKLPMLVLSFLDGVATIFAQSHSTAFQQVKSLPIERSMNVIHSYGWYLAKTFVPTNLMVLYPHPSDGLPWAEVLISLGCLLVITAYVIICRNSRGYLSFGWLWYAISLLPVIGLLQVGLQLHADRYTYVPHIGLFVMIVWEACQQIERQQTLRWLFIPVAIVWTFMLSVQTFSQVGVWRSTETLWTHALSIQPDHPFAHGALAVTRLESGNIDEAIKHFEFVLKKQPEKRRAIERFVEIYRKYSGRDDAQSEFRTELGAYYADEKSLEPARIAFEKAVTLSPDNRVARYRLAMIQGDLGRFHEAKGNLEMLLSQDPGEINATIALALLLEKMGQISAARDCFVEVLKHNPENDATINKIKSLNKRLGL